MTDIGFRVVELGLQGRCCAQVMVQLALEERGEENQQMADAVGALCYGHFSGIGCGALSGGALAMWLLAAGPVDGTLLEELVDWFRDRYGATDCDVILGSDPSARLAKCPGIVTETYEQARSLVVDRGLWDPAQG